MDCVEVVFSPSVSGEFIDSLMILSNDPREPRVVVRLVGYSGNYVSGVITENTVWTRSNSPLTPYKYIPCQPMYHQLY